MPENEAVNQLQALDAIASEQDAVLAFRVCEETAEFEPVFVRVFRANADEENEAALIAISDDRGMSLGRYIVPRGRLDRALERAEVLDDDGSADDADLTVVPADWELAE
jgi:hypothetical protein